MSHSGCVLVDPFSKNATREPPRDLVFACAYLLDIGPDLFEQASFFRRSDAQDELWVTFPNFSDEIDFRNFTIERTRQLKFTIGHAVSAPSNGDPVMAWTRLMKHLFFSLILQCWPGPFVAGGLIGEADYQEMVSEYDAELDRNRDDARKNETQIIRVARELGLNPRPFGRDTNTWLARHPGKNYPLFLSAKQNEFTSPWFGVHGGPDELRALVLQHSKTPK